MLVDRVTFSPDFLEASVIRSARLSLYHPLSQLITSPGLTMPARPGIPAWHVLGQATWARGRQDRLKAVEGESRRLYADKLVDLANIVIGALGQLLSERGFSFRVTLMGLILFISGYLMSYLFLRTR